VGVRGQVAVSGGPRVTKENFSMAAAFIAAMLATAQAAMAQPNAGPEQAQIDQGKTTFAEKCSHCHGPNMVNSGTITPDLRRFPDDRERFFVTVKSGKNNKMPPWGDLLNDDQIACLWAYVSSQRKP
jgi:mono/diheme cytochrome c family protein